MSSFPWFDPIPLPAPVWLFKALHIVTLALHFVAVQMLLGGLLVAAVLCWRGASKPLYRHAAGSLASRMTMVMTFVINLGVPPLLFAQVLYGPPFYVSNVLIGAYWFSIIPLLMMCYWMLYRFSDGIAEGKNVWWKGLVAWLLAGSISRILSVNMTLMLQPGSWKGMYAASAGGTALPPYDPTLMPRWLFMLAGGFAVSGLWMIWISGRKTLSPDLKNFFAGLGGKMAAAMVAVQGLLFFAILKSQPSVVTEGLSSHLLYSVSAVVWIVMAVLIVIFGVLTALKKPCDYLSGYVAAALTLVLVLAWTIVRDGIRDLTLLSKGYDVWQQTVVTNWSVVISFLLVFGLGIATLVWLISVMMRAKPVMEGGVK